ncbi:MAG TPA: TetR/AcrR family transcriptional regulator [Mobilitalea sp.]|nr:TetR/AcrR family transcriptional regulator [Mobilitalea sp.]
MAHTKIENTLQKIKDAFILLVNEKSFSNINVSDITRAAKINRGTFYLHYQDKYDLLERLENTILDKLQEILKKGIEKTIPRKDEISELFTYSLALETARLLYAEKNIVCVLFKDYSTFDFILKIKKIFIKMLLNALKEAKGNLAFKADIPQKYAEEIVFNNVISVYRFWIAEDQPETPEEIADIITKSRYISPFEILDINNTLVIESRGNLT